MVTMMVMTDDVCCVSGFSVTPSKNKVTVCSSFIVRNRRNCDKRRTDWSYHHQLSDLDAYVSDDPLYDLLKLTANILARRLYFNLIRATV